MYLSGSSTEARQAELELEWSTCLCREHKPNTENILIAANHCHVLFTILNIRIQALLSVVLTFVPCQNVFGMEYINSSRSQSVKYIFLNCWKKCASATS